MNPARNAPSSLDYKTSSLIAMVRESFARTRRSPSPHAFAPLRTMALLVAAGLIAELILR